MKKEVGQFPSAVGQKFFFFFLKNGPLQATTAELVFVTEVFSQSSGIYCLILYRKSVSAPALGGRQ